MLKKIHIKGRILQLLQSDQQLWDHEICHRINKEYLLEGAYWQGAIRASLADLYSCGLIESVEEALDDGKHFGTDKIMFRYRVTDFGIERMKGSKLIKGW